MVQHRQKEALLTLREAAEYLRIAQGTLKNWIWEKKFTSRDGLVYVGPYPRIDRKILQQRVEQGLVGRRKPSSNNNHRQ